MRRPPPAPLGIARYAIATRFPPPRLWPRVRGLSREELRWLGKRWYHDYSPLGFKTPQGREVKRRNQLSKQPHLFRMIDGALRRCSEDLGRADGLELFCADGFFGNYAALRGATSILGVDREERPLVQARLAAKILGIEARARFERRDVFEVEGSYDFAICAGGLYHLSDPRALLARLRGQVRRALVVQTVYSLASTSPNYFETPAPGWTWGSRFSADFLLSILAETGWKVLETCSNELGGNARPEDRGSIYARCEPAG
jgi:2-polyprenyl-3-methyl-5-hydroxy-6-metoxy-1,4-benzoquinol methylase